MDFRQTLKWFSVVFNDTNPTQPNTTQQTQPNLTKPIPTQSNQIQPNPTQPNKTQPNKTQPNPNQQNQFVYTGCGCDQCLGLLTLNNYIWIVCFTILRNITNELREKWKTLYLPWGRRSTQSVSSYRPPPLCQWITHRKLEPTVK